MSFILKFTPLHPKDAIGQYQPDPASHYWFVREGDPWPGRPHLRMIAETSPDRSKAKVFELAPEAAEQLVRHDNPSGWEIVPA